MAGLQLKLWTIAGLACVVLTGCEMDAGSGPITDGPISSGPVAPATSTRLIDRDVEAPEIFQASDKALWDGRPSLGGVWVAYAQAKDPERVIMRNPANGKFVIGALFHREADQPGPRMQLSSDAAEALGMLAGAPATISVTALRRDEAPAARPDAKAPLLDSNEPLGTPAPIATSTIDQGPIAAPALPAAKAAAKAAKPAAAAPAPGTGALIQVGIFSVEANANRAVSLLKKSGIAATLSRESSQGKDLWSVTARGNAALLAKIKSAGFKDAYVLKR